MIKKIAKFLLSPILGKKQLQRFFLWMYVFSLRGMNIGSGDFPETSGERFALSYVKEKLRHDTNASFVVFDVGANKGEYTNLVLEVFGDKATVYAFEPSPVAREVFAKNVDSATRVHLVQTALSDNIGSAQLFGDAPASGLNSLVHRNLNHLQVSFGPQTEVEVTTLDAFCFSRSIKSIDLLKIDVEGAELQVLLGSAEMLAQKAIRCIQFEFGGTDIDARVFFRDFYTLLSPNYRLYRILKNGLEHLDSYKERYEIFATTNFLAELKVD